MQNCAYLVKLPYFSADLRPISDTANDRICIFGFSRGAYTARRYASMFDSTKHMLTWAILQLSRNDSQGILGRVFASEADKAFAGWTSTGGQSPGLWRGYRLLHSR